MASGSGGDDAYHGTRDARVQYLKVVRRAGSWIYYASPDGQRWDFLRQFALTCAVDARVGLVAQAPLSSGFSARFDTLDYRAATIRDFWQGQ